MSAELVWKIGLTASQNGKSAVIDGSLQFAEAGSPFVKFENLKEKDVLQWCWDNGVDKNAVENKAILALQNVLSPPVVNKAAPWIVAE